MKTAIGFVVIALVLILLAACSKQAPPTATPTLVPTALPTKAPTKVPTKVPAATPAQAPKSSATPASTPSNITLPTQVPTPTFTDSAGNVTAQSVLEACIKATRALNSYHFRTDVNLTITLEGSESTIPISMTGDFQAPDRKSGYLSVTFGITPVDFEIVSIGKVEYSREYSSSTWEKSVSSLGFFLGSEEFLGLRAVDFKYLELVGQESLNGLPVYHLKGTTIDGAFGEIAGELEMELWITVYQGYLFKATAKGFTKAVAGSDNPISTMTQGVESAYIVINHFISEFNKNVWIEPPIADLTPTTTESSYTNGVPEGCEGIGPEDTGFDSCLARYLKEIGAVMYGATDCSYCDTQKKLFNGHFEENVKYVSCDSDTTPEEAELCTNSNVRGTPTWEINGRYYPGAYPLDVLAEIALYPVPVQ